MDSNQNNSTTPAKPDMHVGALVTAITGGIGAGVGLAATLGIQDARGIALCSAFCAALTFFGWKLPNTK